MDEKCTRCNGMLHAAVYWDLQTSGIGFYQYTCINCGYVVDNVILQNKGLTTMPKSAKERKRDRRVLHTGAVGSYIRKDYNQSTPPIRMEHK